MAKGNAPVTVSRCPGSGGGAVWSQEGQAEGEGEDDEEAPAEGPVAAVERRGAADARDEGEAANTCGERAGGERGGAEGHFFGFKTYFF